MGFRSRRASPLAGLIIGLVFAGLGSALSLLIAGPNLASAKSSTSWPTVQGTITTSKVERHTSTRKGHVRTRYDADVQFTYVVGGKPHESNDIWIGGGSRSSSQGAAEKTIQRYPVGAPVEVHYDPANPGVGVLEPGAFASHYALYYIGWGVAAVGTVVAGLGAAAMSVRRG